MDESNPQVPAPDPRSTAPWNGMLLVCDRFEAAWRSEQLPRIEDYLGEAPERDRLSLLRELLALELGLRRDRGDSPAAREYHGRFARETTLIDAVFNETVPPTRSRPTMTWQPAIGSAAPGPATLPERFGRYQIVKRLGGGAMGTVYLAHDRTLDRSVALKVPIFTTADGPQVFARFLREARAAAMLHHPSLCPIHDAGQIDGTHYLTMGYIEGQPFSEFLRGGRGLDARKAAALVRTMAIALAEAHQAGVIHRDLKPANIIINRRGLPVIVDFGLARRFRKTDEQLTETGMTLGTPAYMPPEQLGGSVAAMGPGCDIYSLGVILYESLTGSRPFRGSVAEIMAQILYKTPEPPSIRRPELDLRLDVICLKAMSKQPADRFATMNDMAEALGDYLRAKRPLGPSTKPVRPSAPATAPAPAEVDRETPLERSRRPLRVFGITIAAGAALVLFIAAAFSLREPQGELGQAPVPPASPPKDSTPPGSPVEPTREFPPPVVPSDDDPRINELTERIRLNPSDLKAYNQRGNRYFDRAKRAAGEAGQKERALADYDRAIADYSEVIHQDPSQATAFFNRGGTLLEKGLFSQAIADLTRAIELKSNEADFFTNRGNAYIGASDFDLAIRDFNEAIALAPNDFKPFLGRGLAYAKKGDSARSQEDYLEADRLRGRGSSP